MIALLLGLALAGDCDPPIASTEVAAHLSRASAHFSSAEVDPFVAEVEAALAAVDCIREPLEPHLIAELHRARGVLAFVRKDVDKATTAFAAARSLEPEFRFPETLLPAQHPLREQYDAVDASRGKTVPVAEPKRGRMTFDGAYGSARPVDRPTVWQRVSIEGAVVDSAYVTAADTLPLYDAKRPPSPLVKPLLATSVGTGLASVALLGAAAASRAGFDNLDTASAEGQARLDGARGRTNGLLLTSGAVAVIE